MNAYCLLISRGVVNNWICCKGDTLFFRPKAILSRAFILDLWAWDLLASVVPCSIAFRSNHIFPPLPTGGECNNKSEKSTKKQAVKIPSEETEPIIFHQATPSPMGTFSLSMVAPPQAYIIKIFHVDIPPLRAKKLLNQTSTFLRKISFAK